VRTVRSPMTLERTPAAVRRRPPRLGEHDAEIRAWLQDSG
jgi:crotonobetainyl-CoA:carnitine CoA-transferase CaiB-like acyl-CoA transferase